MLSVQYPEIKSLLVHLRCHITRRGAPPKMMQLFLFKMARSMTQSFLYESLWFRGSRARRRDTGCAQHENLETSFARNGLFSSRSRDPPLQTGARGLRREEPPRMP